MAEFASNDDFYDFIDGLSNRLTEAGYEVHGRRLHVLLHEVPWTTSTELFGELRQSFLEIRAAAQLSSDLNLDLDRCLQALQKALH